MATSLKLFSRLEIQNMETNLRSFELHIVNSRTRANTYVQQDKPFAIPYV